MVDEHFVQAVTHVFACRLAGHGMHRAPLRRGERERERVRGGTHQRREREGESEGSSADDPQCLRALFSADVIWSHQEATLLFFLFFPHSLSG